MKFFVTGATGLVGYHVVGRLLEEGHDVAALVRRSSSAKELLSRGARVSLGDLGKERALRDFIGDAEVVVHCAGAVNMRGPREELWEVNVHGTRRLIEASIDRKVARFVHLSSVAVYGRAPVPVVEDAPKKPRGAYPESKWEAERILWREHEERGLPAVALRPCVIYGEHDRHALRVLSRILRFPVLPLPRGGTRLFDMVHAKDVAEAVLAASTLPVAVGNAYNLTDGCRHTVREILQTYGRITGRRPRVLPVPGPILRALKSVPTLLRYVNEGWARRVERLGALDVDVHFSIEAARRDLAYEPRIPLVEGLEKALDWAARRDAEASRLEALTQRI